MSENAPARDRDTEPNGHRARPTHRTDDSSGNGRVDGPGPRTSPAAVFALVFGLIALLSALTGLLAPVAVLFGLIGIVLAILGLRASKKPLITGRGVAIGGLVLAILATLLGAAAIAGVASVISSNPRILDQITTLLDNARAKIPGA